MFKNEYIFNRKLIWEYVLKTLGKKMIVLGVLVFLIGISMYPCYTGVMKQISLLCAVLGIIYMVFMPILIVKNLEDSAKRLNNGKIAKTEIIFDENIVMNEGRVHLEFEYTQIQKIKESKNLIILNLGRGSAILVPKDGFTVGTKEDFMKFIREKVN